MNTSKFQRVCYMLSHLAGPFCVCRPANTV